MMRELMLTGAWMVHAVAMAQDVQESLRPGDEALSSQLWEVAEQHYRKILDDPKRKGEDLTPVVVRMVELYCRSGRYEEAEKCWRVGAVKDTPELKFWQGVVWMETGKLDLAREKFEWLIQEGVGAYRVEAGINLKNLHSSKGQFEAALAVVSQLVETSEGGERARVELHQIEVLQALGRWQEAREKMPEFSKLERGDRAFASYLEGRLLMGEGDYEAAQTEFQSLIEQPQGLSEKHYYLVGLGLVDALIGMGRIDSAVAFLGEFIETHSSSMELDRYFERLLKCLPEQPSMGDPVFDLLQGWIPVLGQTAVPLIAQENASAVAIWPGVVHELNVLNGQAMLAMAKGLQKVGTESAVSQSLALLGRIQGELAGSELADEAMFEQARVYQVSNQEERAELLLMVLKEHGLKKSTRGEAAFELAAGMYREGDMAMAAQYYDEAAGILEGKQACVAKFNAEVLMVSAGEWMAGPVKADEREGEVKDRGIRQEIKLEQALVMRDAKKRMEAIEAFMAQNPSHERLGEARLAAAECALSMNPADLAYARAQLAEVEEMEVKTVEVERMDWVRLRIKDRAGEVAESIRLAKEFVGKYPGCEMTPEVEFLLGRNLYASKSYNEARLVLERLASEHPQASVAKPALLLSARAAALIPTIQSKKESLVILEKMIQSKDPALTVVAMLEKGRLLIDMNQLHEAEQFLQSWYREIKPTDRLQVPVGMLLGEAIYAQGAEKPDSLKKALMVYDQLLPKVEKDMNQYCQIQYLRGKTLEQMVDEKDPTKKCEKEALLAYYSVLEKNELPGEWQYFELCGFRALELLEKSERWQAAIACAKRMGGMNGPRAGEAKARAEQLQLQHMIWDD